jgi:hypothetical protein
MRAKIFRACCMAKQKQTGWCGIRPHFGGNWNNGTNCGSRCANWNNSPLDLNSNNGARGVADTKAAAVSPPLWLAALTRALAQIHNGGPLALVVDAKAMEAVGYA